jgi:hypothetical protein
MKSEKKIGFTGVLLLILLAPLTLFAQFQQLPTPKPGSQKTNLNARVQQDPLSLPFWDDFSSGKLDTTRWVFEGVTHSFTIANAAPSLGVILFDGVDAQGRPYSNNLLEQGLGDQMISQPIDLSQLSVDERETVFLSFQWQAGGKAELPDQNDILSLDLMDASGIWTQVWEKRGNLTDEQFIFTLEMINIPSSFHHKEFKFRFKTSGRKSGPFDAWLIDYVFLNKNRNANNRTFEDRTLTRINPRFLGKYGAVPHFELRRNGFGTLTPVRNEFLNLSNRFRAMEYTVEVLDLSSGLLIRKINNNTPFNPVPLALERRQFNSNPINNLPIPSTPTDFLVRTYLSTGDRFFYNLAGRDTIFFPSVDFRKNDTASVVVPIRDYYAYDDGNVDYSAGINQRSGMLAVRYEVTQPAFITGININFTNFNQIGRVLDLMVWKELDQAPIYRKEVLIPEKQKLEDFTLLELDANVQVNGSFFIGFTQFTNDFIYLGLDKTFDNGREIFFNVAGSWQQNTIVEGSLMMRPHLSLDQPFESEAQSAFSFSIYPNPVVDKLHVEGNFDRLIIYDSFGRSLNPDQEDSGKGKIINFAGLQKGIYLLKIENQGSYKSVRILVK